MPIFELGYRSWTGTLRPPAARVWAITKTGIALAFRSKILKRIVFMAWMPLLYFAPLFFGIGYVTDPTRDLEKRGFLVGIAQAFLGETISARLVTDPESVRPVAWSMAYHLYYSGFQAFFTMLVAAIVGPPLISQDVRTKAFLLYFSKPITRVEYLLGKSGTLFFYLFMITLFPGLVLYGISIALSPNLVAFTQTAPMIGKIVASSMIIAVPTTFVVLCFSSLTSDGRYALMGWFSLCLIGETTYHLFWRLLKIREPWVPLFSLRETMRIGIERVLNVQGQISVLGVGKDLQRQLESYSSTCPPELAFGYLAGLFLVGLIVLWHRISAPVRI